MRREDLEAALERTHPDCFGWALACCGHDRTEAEDVLQDSYLKVLDGRAVFAGRSGFRTWLFGVIRHTALEHHRRRKVRRFLDLEWLRGTPAERAPGPSPAELAEYSERSRLLMEALESLSDRQRDVLHLVFYQELSIREAAHVLGVSVGSARTHYERGKDRLRRLLRREDLA